jgi:Na+/melibiose symporter-like transporter
VFRNRGFANGSLSISLQFLAFYGFVFIGMQYLQLVLGYSPLTAAFALLPMAMTLGLLSRQVAPRLMQRFGGTRVDSIGLAVAALGCCALARLDATSSYWTVLVGLLLLGTGMGLAMTPSTTAIVSALPAAKQGVASAVNDTSREVGGAVGIAVLGSLATAGYQNRIEAHLQGMPPVVRTHARDSLAFVIQAAGRFGPAGQDLMHVARESFVAGMHTAMWVGAALLAAGAIVTYLRRELLVGDDRRRSRDETHVPSLTTVDEATRRAS